MRYFNYTEFDSPDELGSGKNMSPKILEMLDIAREKYDKPIKITSGYRTQAYNENLKARGYKASKNSSHLKGLAVDIHCNNSKDRFELVDILLDVGFNRIGIANTFIHADIDEDKPTHLIWTY
tara:strand:+ start:1050 stop:1418 length:369 start_codon:yes stop_codon:yes gene_type:complete